MLPSCMKNRLDHRQVKLKLKAPYRCLASVDNPCSKDEGIGSLEQNIESLNKQKEEIEETISKYKNLIAESEEELEEDETEEDEREEDEREEDEREEDEKEKLQLRKEISNKLAYTRFLNFQKAQQMNQNMWDFAANLGKNAGKFNPLGNPTSQDRYEYLKLVEIQKLGGRMDQQTSWTPSFNSSGDLRNPIYGYSHSWDELSHIHRNPTVPFVQNPLGY